jgi:hypothetical protein
MCVMTVWRIAVDPSNNTDFNLQKLQTEIGRNLQSDELRREFHNLLKAANLQQTVSRIKTKIEHIRHNKVAHFRLAKHMKPTPKEVKERAILLSDLQNCRDGLNAFFEVLCFGHGRAMLPIEYWPDEKRPASFECDVDKLLEGVARNSDLLNLPENNPELWAVHKPEQSETDLRILNQYRTKFGLPPA